MGSLSWLWALDARALLALAELVVTGQGGARTDADASAHAGRCQGQPTTAAAKVIFASLRHRRQADAAARSHVVRDHEGAAMAILYVGRRPLQRRASHRRHHQHLLSRAVPPYPRWHGAALLCVCEYLRATTACWTHRHPLRWPLLAAHAPTRAHAPSTRSYGIERRNLGHGHATARRFLSPSFGESGDPESQSGVTGTL